MTDGAANAAMEQEWDGTKGEFWARNQEHFDRSLRLYLDELIDAADVQRTDTILDVGCGSGASSVAAARIARDGFVDGFDLSSEMLRNGERRAEAAHLVNVRFIRADVQTYQFDPEQYDLAISRFGSMFFEDPVAAFVNIGRALKPGGRVCFAVWRPIEDNHYFAELRRVYAPFTTAPPPAPDAPGPFAFADADRVRWILNEANLADVEVRQFDAPMWAGSSQHDAWEFESGSAAYQTTVQTLSPDAQRQLRDTLLETFTSHQTANGVEFPGSTWIVTARRE